MILTGQYDSPFVRRVAVTLQHYGMPYERQVMSVYGEFERVARRSKCMRDRLERVQKELATAPLRSENLGLLAEQVADCMTSEVLDWRILFKDRPPELG